MSELDTMDARVRQELETHCLNDPAVGTRHWTGDSSRFQSKKTMRYTVDAFTEAGYARICAAVRKEVLDDDDTVFNIARVYTDEGFFPREDDNTYALVTYGTLTPVHPDN
jgi:hypothetical protein